MNKSDYLKQYRLKSKDRFYVYIHRKLSDNSPFYVGKGSGDRAWVTSGRNSKWNRTIKKYGYTVEIIFDQLPEDESLQLEKDTILEFEYFGYSLCNLTSGGESTKISKESILRMSEAHKGKKLTNEQKLKISNALTGIKRSQEEISKSAIKRSGLNCSNADKNIYTFENENGQLFSGTRTDFRLRFNLQKHTVKKLFGRNARIKSGGWSIRKDYGT
jgi:hypothetical protein